MAATLPDVPRTERQLRRRARKWMPIFRLSPPGERGALVRPAATGLATAFYRLYLLDALATEPARPAALLARIAAERLPLSSGGFSRALQALLEGGYLVAASEGAVALTA